jgi:hypothetical protein
MSNRSTIPALAAIATIGTMALTSTSAFAVRVSGGTSSSSSSTSTTVHVNPALTHVSPSSFARLPHLTPVTSPHLTPVTPLLPPAAHLTPTLPPAVHLDPDHDHDHDHDQDHDGWHHHHDHDWWVWWHQPRFGVVEYGTVNYGMVGSVGTQATVPSAPCNCLTKRYLDDGSVLFTDLCTQEQAMATPAELRAQAQGIPMQGSTQ